MKKKEYISPAITTIEMNGDNLLLNTSGQLGEEVDCGSNAAPAYGEVWEQDDWYDDYDDNEE